MMNIQQQSPCGTSVSAMAVRLVGRLLLVVTYANPIGAAALLYTRYRVETQLDAERGLRLAAEAEKKKIAEDLQSARIIARKDAKSLTERFEAEKTARVTAELGYEMVLRQFSEEQVARSKAENEAHCLAEALQSERKARAAIEARVNVIERQLAQEQGGRNTAESEIKRLTECLQRERSARLAAEAEVDAVRRDLAEVRGARTLAEAEARSLAEALDKERSVRVASQSQACSIARQLADERDVSVASEKEVKSVKEQLRNEQTARAEAESRVDAASRELEREQTARIAAEENVVNVKEMLQSERAARRIAEAGLKTIAEQTDLSIKRLEILVEAERGSRADAEAEARKCAEDLDEHWKERVEAEKVVGKIREELEMERTARVAVGTQMRKTAMGAIRAAMSLLAKRKDLYQCPLLKEEFERHPNRCTEYFWEGRCKYEEKGNPCDKRESHHCLYCAVDCPVESKLHPTAAHLWLDRYHIAMRDGNLR